MRTAEFVFIYAAIPAAVWYYDIRVIPALLLASALAAYGLHRDGYDFRALLETPSQQQVTRVLAVFGTIAALTAAASLLLGYELGRIWRMHWALGLAITVLYPLLSVAPQTLLYRVFYEQRYAYGTLVGAAAFSFSHLVMHNALAIILTFIGGWVFLRRYEQTRNFLLVCLEHSLYGILVFNTALGPLFVS